MEKGAQVKVKKSNRWKDRWVVLRQEGLAVYKTKSEYELLHMYKLAHLVACLHTPLKGRPNVMVLVVQANTVMPTGTPQQNQDNVDVQVLEDISPRQKTMLVYIDMKQRMVMEDYILTMANFRAKLNTLDVLSWHSLLPAKVIEAVTEGIDEKATILSIPSMSNCQRLGFVCTSRPSFDADWWWTAAHDMLVPYQQTDLETTHVTRDELQTVPESPEEDEVDDSEEEYEEELNTQSIRKEKSEDKLQVLVNAPLRVGYLYKKKNRGGINTSRKNTIKLQAEVVPGTVRSTGASGVRTDVESPVGGRPSLPSLNVNKSQIDHDPSYHPRYFVLRGSTLSWYQDAREYEVLKMLDMKDVVWMKLDLKIKGTTSDNIALSSDEETVDESDEEFNHSLQAKSLVSKLKVTSSTATPTSAKGKKFRKGKNIQIAFGMGVSQLSVISNQSTVSSAMASPVNVVVKQIALPTSQNALMEISVTRSNTTPMKPKHVKMLAREWSSGIGILDELLQQDSFQVAEKKQQLNESLLLVFAQCTQEEVDYKRIKALAAEDGFISQLSKAVLSTGTVIPYQTIQAAWSAFFQTLNVPIKPLPSLTSPPVQEQDPNNKTTDELIQKSVIALAKFQTPIGDAQNKSSRLYQIRLVTVKRDYVLATESPTEFVKWTIALRRAWISSRL